MGLADYQFGEMTGARRERAATASWQNYAAELENRLAAAEKKIRNEEIERLIAVDYVQALRDAVRHLDPKHPLLNDEQCSQRFSAVRERLFAERGYDFDSKTNRVKKAR